MRFLLAVMLGVSGGLAAAPEAEITVRELAIAAAPGAAAPNVALARDGTVWLSWIENAPGSDEAAPAATQLRLARLPPDADAVTAVPALAAAGAIAPSLADVPQLAVDGRGRVHVVWLDGALRAQRAVFDPAATAWSEPAPFTLATGERERFSLARLQDGRVLAAWLDSRDYPRTRQQALFARIVDAPDDSEQRVATRVCECCETALTPLLDGGALLAFRGRSAEEVRDIQVARWQGGAWSEPRLVHADGWRIKACPVNGPRIHGNGSQAALAWFTAAGGPQVLVSLTPDASGRWLSPLRVDGGQPAGHVDTVRLRDGAVLVSWLEVDGALWLRRITPEFVAGAAVRLAPPGGVALRTVPRLALRQDYAGGETAASLVVVHQQPRGGLRLVEAVVPEGALLRGERSCDCAPTADELRGFSLRGRVLHADPAAGRIQIDHTEVPGVLAAGRREFAIAAPELLTLTGRTEFLARVEPHENGWRLFAVRALAAPAR